MTPLNNLKNYRPFILLCESIGMLHDIGKYYEGVVIGGNEQFPPHYHNTLGALFLNVKKLKDRDVLNSRNEISTTNGKEYKDIDLSTLPFRLTSNAFNTKFDDIGIDIPECWKEKLRDLTIGGLSLTHHSFYRGYGDLIAKSPVEKLISEADSLDSSEDREGATNNKYVVLIKKDSVLHSPFGSKEQIKYYFKDEEEILNKIAECIEKREFEGIYETSRRLKKVWCFSPADSRIPFNDTTLWNHCYMVASIFKALVAHTIITEGLVRETKVKDIFGILSIQSPNRDFLTNVYRLPDYNGRRQAIQKVRGGIKELIEYGCPLGNCVYEDVNGQYFLLPVSIKDQFDDLQQAIVRTFQDNTKGSILPRISFSPCTVKGKVLNIGKTVIALKKEYDTNARGLTAPYHFDKTFIKPEWTDTWNGQTGKEICHVCGKMPAMENEHVLYHDKVCGWCGDNRKREPHDEAGSEAKFMNEVMDSDQRVSLLVGEIGLLDQWLNGDYIQTTFSYNREQHHKIPKPTSPSRMRQIWEIADTFDKKLMKLYRNENEVLQVKRLKLSVKYDDSDKKANRIYSHKLNSTFRTTIRNYLIGKGILDNNELKKAIESVMKVVTCGGKQKNIELLIKNDTAETVSAYPDVVFDINVSVLEIIRKYLIDCRELIEFVFEEGRGELLKIRFKTVENYSGNGFIDGFKTVSKIKKIYSLSGEFMYLLPAKEALKIAGQLKDEFEDKFNKVSGRLCLNLGLVYADNNYPLYMILDAGKRMLREFKEANRICGNGYSIKSTGGKAHGIQGRVYKNENKQIIVKFEEHLFNQEAMIHPDETIWKFEKKDKKDIQDNYYPYLLRKLPESNELEAVYVENVSDNDEIIYAPGIFDFEWLDSSKARVNLTIKKNHGSTSGDWRKRDNLFPLVYTRPYLLSRLGDIIAAGRCLVKVQPSTTALENLRESLSNEIYHWFKDKADFPKPEDRTMIEKLVCSMLENMNGLQGENGLGGDKEELAGFIKVFGRNLEIFDFLELHLFLKAFEFINP